MGRLRFTSLALVAAACLCVLAGCGDDGRAYGGEVELPASTAEGASWSPDGRWIAIPNRQGVLLRGVGGGKRKQLLAPPLRRHLGLIPGRIGWAPDGSEVRYVTNVGPSGRRGAWMTLVPTEGGETRQVPLGTSIVTNAWSPHGWPLVYSTGPYAIGGGGRDIGPKAALWTVESPDSPPRLLLDLKGEEDAPEFSPDGKRLAFGFSPNERVLGLWVARSDGSHPRRLAGPLGSLAYRWSPDGRQIALVAATMTGDRRQRLYVVDAGGGPLRKVSDDEVDGEPAWTPDGRWITYATFEGNVKSIRPDGSGIHTIVDRDHEHVRDLMWSPDGEHLAFSAEEIVTSD